MARQENRFWYNHLAQARVNFGTALLTNWHGVLAQPSLPFGTPLSLLWHKQLAPHGIYFGMAEDYFSLLLLPSARNATKS